MPEILKASLPPGIAVQTSTALLVTVYEMFYTEKVPKIAMIIIINLILYVYLFIRYSSLP